MILFLRNQRGVSLVQTMMAMGVSSIVIAGMASAMVGMYKHQRRLEAKFEMTTLASDVYTQSFYPMGCQNLFHGEKLNEDLSDTEVEFSFVKNLANEKKKKEKYEEVLDLQGLSVNYVKFKKIQSPNVTLPSGNQILTASVALSAGLEVAKADEEDDEGKLLDEIEEMKEKDKKEEKAFSIAFRERVVAHLVLEVNDENTIQNCYNIGADESRATNIMALCDSLGFEYDKEKGVCNNSGEYACASLGGTWDMDQCNFSYDAIEMCRLLGGQYSNGKCQMEEEKKSVQVAAADNGGGNSGNSGSRSLSSSSSSSEKYWKCTFHLKGQKGHTWKSERYVSSPDQCNSAEKNVVAGNNPNAQIVSVGSNFVRDKVNSEHKTKCTFNLKGPNGATWKSERYVASGQSCSSQQKIVERNNPKATITSNKSNYVHDNVKSAAKKKCTFWMTGKKGYKWKTERYVAANQSCSSQYSTVRRNNPNATIRSNNGNFVKK